MEDLLLLGENIHQQGSCHIVDAYFQHQQCGNLVDAENMAKIKPYCCYILAILLQYCCFSHYFCQMFAILLLQFCSIFPYSCCCWFPIFLPHGSFIFALLLPHCCGCNYSQQGQFPSFLFPSSALEEIYRKTFNNVRQTFCVVRIMLLDDMLKLLFIISIRILFLTFHQKHESQV